MANSSRQMRDVVAREAPDEMILLHRRLGALLQAIPEAIDAGIGVGIVIGQPGADDLHRRGSTRLSRVGVLDDTRRWRAGAHQAELIAGAVLSTMVARKTC
jgi:hypothetical protein